MPVRSRLLDSESTLYILVHTYLTMNLTLHASCELVTLEIRIAREFGSTPNMNMMISPLESLFDAG